MRLDDVLANLGDAVVLVNSSGSVALMNPAAQELTGFSEAHVLGHPYDQVFERIPAIASLVERTLATGQSQSIGDGRIDRLGRSAPVRVSCSPVWEQTGSLEGCAIVIHDLSHQQKLQDEVRRNEALARLGGLVAGLAHEVKNPLGGIRGAAQLLAQRHPVDAEIAQFTGLMIREIDRLSRLVEQLLTLGAPPIPNPQPLNVHRLLHEVIALLHPELSGRGVVVKLQVDPSLPDTAGDETQLVHLFINLVKNAMEAMKSGGTLTISTRMETDYRIQGRAGSGKFLRVEIADTGPGFPEDGLEKVFEPFFTTKVGGSGLGLAICQRIVAIHEGDIRADNLSKGGAVIMVNLPLLR